ncbi:tail length tape-measure protein [Caulobacter phage TMCBR2]|uniref:Tail length tape-measure protein n=1 Tax=Caulobacter phage TMCBR2 TaxID=3025404 RepID=A0AAE9YG16_9CAUD|nr:tail length tape-measure protein [Caulobacter phage TMCBR2]WDS38263.1 tail length tape-measure protein [Caulobacter phage TMCBR3]
MPAVIGTLRADLTAGIAEFTDGFNKAADQVKKLGAKFEQVGQSMKDFGGGLTKYVTAPLAAMAVGVVKVSGDFESAMTRVSIATQATSTEMASLEKASRDIGKTTIFSASQAAGAMEELAKTGVSVTDILGGAGKAAVDLAAATGSELEPAATATADVMNQFKISASDLGSAVNQITGAVNESKLDFADYTLAIGQAGGVAGSLGVSFKDFNTALAATSPLFSSGQDAGTSFKTFLTALVPSSKQAAEKMKELGLQFFDAQGNMKPMADIAQMLQDKLKGLSQEARNDALKTIFGSDAMRTAIGLMDQGAAGLDKIAQKIAATDAAAQSDKRMQGFNGQLEQLKGSLEELAIAIGQSGLLTFVTNLVTGLAGFVDKLAALDPKVLAFGTVLAGIAAAAGPVIVAIGSVISAIGAITPVVAGIMGALGALAGGAGFAGLMVAIAPVAATVAAVVAAFMLVKDDVMPVLADLWTKAQATLGPPFMALMDGVKNILGALGQAFQKLKDGPVGSVLGWLAATWTSIFGNLLIRLLNGFLVVLKGAMDQVANIIRFITAILSGDWKGAWEQAWKMVQTAVGTIGRLVTALVPEVVNAFARMVTGVQQWLHDKLPAIFKAPQVVNATANLSKNFATMKTEVVDKTMPAVVAGVKEHADRLPAALGEGAEKATKRAKQAFDKLKDDIKSVMDSLLTPGEQNVKELETRLETIAKAKAAGIIDAATAAAQESRAWEDAMKKANPNFGTETPLKAIKPPSVNIISDDQLAKANAQLEAQAKALQDSMTKAWAAVKDIGLGAMQEWVNTGKLNWKRLANDLIRNWDSTMKVLGDLWSRVSGAMSSTGGTGAAGKVGLFTTVASAVKSVFGGFRANGGSVQPGKVYMTGERGPEPFMTRTSGMILPNGSLGSGPPAGGNTVIINANDAVLAETVKGWVRDGMAAAEQSAVVGAIRAAVEIVPQEMARQSSNSFV